jgi:DNA helicase HerA-like ATPase
VLDPFMGIGSTAHVRMTVKIGRGESGPVTLDVARLLVSRLLVTAASGGGKSYLLRKILECVSKTTQTIVIDPEGEFSSLREIRDMVLVGPDGDIPADPRSAGLLCRRLIETNVSAVHRHLRADAGEPPRVRRGVPDRDGEPAQVAVEELLRCH